MMISAHCSHRKKHKVLLVVFTHAVVHPRTVVVHLPDTALTHTAREETHTHMHRVSFSVKVGHGASLSLSQSLGVYLKSPKPTF